MAQGILGRYHLIAHLGGGATSDVSLAKPDASSEIAKLSVIKRLKLGADAESDVAALFSGEAALCLRLDHPNIARAFEAGEDADGPFLVLEYVEGQSLARIRSRARRRAAGVPRALALHIVKEMAAGLAYAHALEDEAGKPLKIVHRDVSPENVIVTYTGTTKLIDFSVATAAVPSTKARAGVFKGSVAYIAPEQARSDVKLDARADVFATGLVLWELLAGKRMWEGMSEADVMARLADSTPLPSVRTVVPDVPEALDALCSQALAKVRDDRFDSAVELLEAIEKVSKAPELKTTPREVGDFVTSLFEDEQEKMRAVVDGALAPPAAGAEALPRLGPLPPTSANAFVDVETDPSLWIGAGPAAAAPAAAQAPAPAPTPLRIVEVLRVEQGPSRDRRFAFATAGAVLIAFAVVAVVALTTKKDPEKPLVTADPRPTATAMEPATSAFAEPEEVTIEITVRPLTGRLFVDGVKSPVVPHRVKVVRGKYTHEVRAEADGFEPRTMTIVFDRDRSIDIALTPKPQPHVPLPPPRAAGSSSPSATPSATPSAKPAEKDRDAQ